MDQVFAIVLAPEGVKVLGPFNYAEIADEAVNAYRGRRNPDLHYVLAGRGELEALRAEIERVIGAAH